MLLTRKGYILFHNKASIIRETYKALTHLFIISNIIKNANLIKETQIVALHFSISLKKIKLDHFNSFKSAFCKIFPPKSFL
ncbi:hypothetical protein CLV62_11326 [Dysgonomonas alginatilytica]|uniref:Uncharacterized protein n=1 Tax=Dysgonomonas alginatilytica TaxID=1605892 RepID=A0A2V3PN03_9BACT|nr:hypothetical protein CLV62_11326 [Dysgonomonas alginatilytica]